MIRTLTAFMALVASANAACDNQCSGHGTCQTDDVCSCYDNWGVGLSMDSGDCSDRICPYELAWVDTPNVDGSFHKYLECAGRGICDRSSGNCECFDGYEGKGCQRTTCPNDCSGHGTCEYIEDMGYRAVWNDYQTEDLRSDSKTFTYNGWDNRKIRGCVCDAQYADVDCSKRMCPYGTDVMAVRDNLLIDNKYHVQQIVFRESALKPLQGRTFALTFKSKLNETFTTVPISFDYITTSDFVTDIRLALLTLPNKVIDKVNVEWEYMENVDGDDDADDFDDQTVIRVTFTGDAVQGTQHLLTVEDYACKDGCTPKLTGLPLDTVVQERYGAWGDDDNDFADAFGDDDDQDPLKNDNANSIFDGTISGVATILDPDFNSYECGRRGKCDYNTGLCACFAGYSGENCNQQTILV